MSSGLYRSDVDDQWLLLSAIDRVGDFDLSDIKARYRATWLSAGVVFRLLILFTQVHGS